MNRFRFVALSLLLLVPLSCDKNRTVDVSGVDPIAEEILNAIAQDTPQTVYDKYFTAEYKSDMSPEEWKEYANNYQTMFGKVTSVKRLRGGAKWIADQFIDGTVIYSVTWEKGDGEMTLDVTKEGGWMVRQVRIESPQIDERVDKLKVELKTKPAK